MMQNGVSVRGDFGKKGIREANEKIREVHNTAKGLVEKLPYEGKEAVKRQIINQLSELKLISKASLELETIQDLINLLD